MKSRNIFYSDKNIQYIWVADLLYEGSWIYSDINLNGRTSSCIRCRRQLLFTADGLKNKLKHCLFLLNQISNDKSYRSGPDQTREQPLMPVTSLIWRVCEEMPEAARAR